MSGLFADTQLRPEIPRQWEFFVVQSWRLADHEFHHLDIFIKVVGSEMPAHLSPEPS
jgi:hypothetical protein